LFAGELSDLYKLYFQSKGYNYSTISESCVGAHVKEIIFSVEASMFSEFSSETGIHRVQRVPQTDSQGRIHTSAVSVAVIPKYFQNEESFNEKDVRMDVYRSSGPGGQNVNKTNSAVRLVHSATGITVCMQDERSQIENKVKAFKVLKLRLQERARNLNSSSTRTIREQQVRIS
jgi:peptide chain release factor 1